MLPKTPMPSPDCPRSNCYRTFGFFFLAGHETTATALTWACICLGAYPEIQEKIYREIVEKLGKDKVPTFDDLSKLEYLECFINENLRLNPPVGLLPTRRATEDIRYKEDSINQVIPKDAIIGIFFRAIHTHPDHWENPEKFDPDRFLPDNRKGRHHFAFMPFSLGPRQCIGNNFSLVEQRLFLTRLLQKFEVKLAKHSKPHPVNEPIPPDSKEYRVPIQLQVRN